MQKSYYNLLLDFGKKNIIDFLRPDKDANFKSNSTYVVVVLMYLEQNNCVYKRLSLNQNI